MGLLDRFTKKDLREDGLPGTALLRATPSWRVGLDQDPDSVGTFSWPLELDLEIRIEGREPYAVSQSFKVPKRWFEISKGIELPLQVDPNNADRILIDWDAFADAGGDQLVAERAAENQVRANRKTISSNPVAQQNSNVAVNGWLGAVKAGGMTVDEFNGYVDQYVTAGLLTPEDGDAAKAQAAG